MRKVEEFLIYFSILGITAIMNVNVVMRYFFNSSWTPTEEICLIFIVVVTFMGSAHATRLGMHLFSSLIFDLTIVPMKFKRILAITISTVCAILCLLLTILSINLVKENFISGRVTPSMGIPFFTFYLILPISFLIMTWHNIKTIFANIKNKNYSLSYEDVKLEENS